MPPERAAPGAAPAQCSEAGRAVAFALQALGRNVVSLSQGGPTGLTVAAVLSAFGRSAGRAESRYQTADVAHAANGHGLAAPV